MSGLGVPVEIGLPFAISNYKPIATQLPALARELLDHSVTCTAIHAPEGDVVTRYTDTFLKWAGRLSDFANQVSAEVIVFHPKKPTALNRRTCLDFLVKNVAALQKTTRAVITVETFKGLKWIDYKAVIAAGLPLCLDTSHLSHRDTLEVLDGHLGQVRHIHISEAGDGDVHEPVGEFGTQVLHKLARARWAGSVCFEYMDEYFERAIEDCKRFHEQY